MKKILLVAHAPSPNTENMAKAVLAGINHPDIENVTGVWCKPLECGPEQVKSCDAIILGTTENLGYMSGALKDFFDRIYYPCLEQCQGKPMATYIRAGHDGTGAKRAIETICTGLKWRQTLPTLVCQGPWNEAFIEQCEELGMTLAAGLDAGIY